MVVWPIIGLGALIELLNWRDGRKVILVDSEGLRSLITLLLFRSQTSCSRRLHWVVSLKQLYYGTHPYDEIFELFPAAGFATLSQTSLGSPGFSTAGIFLLYFPKTPLAFGITSNFGWRCCNWWICFVVVRVIDIFVYILNQGPKTETPGGVVVYGLRSVPVRVFFKSIPECNQKRSICL